jgi:hypothetical protein
MRMVTWLPVGDTISLSCTFCEGRCACGVCAELWRYIVSAMVYLYLPLYIHPLYIQLYIHVYTYLLCQIHVSQILRPLPPRGVNMNDRS